MDTLESIASCDLEFGLLCKLNDLMKDSEQLRSWFAQSFLIRFCMFYAYSRPRYQVNVYRTIGPLGFFALCKDTYAIYCDFTAVKKSLFFR